ncbi:hypothetical protein [Kitasatospora sp. NPDC088351]|uniref:hypothetical protein n=1 Tax=Kitasatospora sp. NPDC088351 TaxID=3155180 RepID=UPI0034293EFE
MKPTEATSAELASLDRALQDALTPLATALRARATGLTEDRMWNADPIEVTLSVLAAWKVVDTEVERLTAIAARTAGSYGANYEQLGAAWGITRQGARKKWPDAVERPAAKSDRATVELFGGKAELSRDPASGHWRWTARGADGTAGTTDSGTSWATKEEAAAHAGAFLNEHATGRR